MRLPLVLLVLLSLLVALPCLFNAPAYDDELLIWNNPYAHDLAHLGENLSRDFFYTQSATPLGYYRPLVKLAFMLQYQLFGADVLGYHGVTIVAFLGVVVTAYLLLLRSLGTPLWAALAAGLFASHPVQARTLSTIAPQSDVFVALFVLAAFYAYLRASDAAAARPRTWLGLSLGCASLALGCKELGVIVPLLLAGWELAENDLDPKRLPLRRLAFFAVPLFVYALLRIGFDVLPIRGERGPLLGSVAAAGQLAVRGVARSVAPLSWVPELYETRPAATLASALGWGLSGLALLAASALAFVRVRVPALRLGLLLLWLPLLPVLSGESMIHMSDSPDVLKLPDRWLYLSALGGSVLLVVAVRAAVSQSEQRIVKIVAPAALVPLILTQALTTADENASYATENSRLVYLAEIYRAHRVSTRQAREVVLAADAVVAEQRGDLEGAVRAYQAQLENHPESSIAYYNLAVSLLRAGRAREALTPAFIAFHGRSPDGTRVLSPHYSFDRRRPEKAFLLGQVLEALGETDAARRHFELSIELNPDFAPARDKLASLASSGVR